MQSLGDLIDIEEEELVLFIVDALRDMSPAIGILYNIQSLKTFANYNLALVYFLIFAVLCLHSLVLLVHYLTF